MASLKKNIFYNSIRVGSNLVFPLVTFPYVTRIMGPDTLGLFNYITAIAGYFTLFASLGFPIYGIREVAQSKDDPVKLQSATNAIFTANTLACLVVYAVYFIASLFLAHSEQDFWLYFVLGLSVLLSCISFDWFYQGVEDFKYITIRSIAIKLISIVCLFIFVRTHEDILPYAILTIAGTCGNNILNLIRIRKYVKLKISFQDCWKHTKGASVLFLGTIAVSLYTNLNSVMVGALGTMAAVAFFTTGNKLVQMLMSVLGAITSSIIPRMAYLVGKGDEKEAITLQKKTLNLLLYVSIPMVFGIIALAHPLILLFGGKEFLPAVPVMQILSTLLVIITLSGFLGNQILIPMHKEKYGNYCVGGGAIANLIVNFILIPLFAEIGVAIAVVIAETVVTAMHFYFAHRYMQLKWKDFVPVKCILASILMFLVIVATYSNDFSPLYCFLWAIIGMIVYVVSLLGLKDQYFKETILKLIKR